jgi:hypothetical protein
MKVYSLNQSVFWAGPGLDSDGTNWKGHRRLVEPALGFLQTELATLTGNVLFAIALFLGGVGGFYLISP